jgi:putative hemolysin
MRNAEKILATFFSLLIILLIFVYVLQHMDNIGKFESPSDSFVGEIVQIANPASVYCLQQGGELEIRDDSSGGQVGYCVFLGGMECEEWEYFRGEC